MNKIIIHSDGGARGNPGPAGIGAVLNAEDGIVLAEVSRYIGETTNNQAEYKALIAGIEKAIELGAEEAECYLDSELVVKQLNREYKVKNAELAPLFLKIHNLSLSFKRIEIESLPDTDIGLVGGVTVYKEGCDAARGGNYTVCEALGSTVPAGLISVAGKNGTVKVDAAIYQKYQAAMECVKSKNSGTQLFVINEAFRDATTQMKYWKTKSKGLAAPPCCSNHSSGQAMDVNRIDRVPMSWAYNGSSGLTACMNAQGLKAEIKPKNPPPAYPEAEAWHWSPSGK